MRLAQFTSPLLQAPDPSPSPSPTDTIGDQLTKNGPNQSLTDWLIGAPLRIAIIVVLGLVIIGLLRRAIRLVTERMAKDVPSEKNVLARVSRTSAASDARRAGRARTLGTVLRSATNIFIGSIIVLMVLDQLDINLAPLLASAGVAGVALGFGAQSLVKDFLSGTFLLLEDQYGVGDVVEFDTVTGTIEEVALRVTKVRAFDGTLWYLRNGEIISTGNRSQGWGRALVDVRVGYNEDIDQVRSLLAQAAAEVAADPEFSADMIDEPDIWGVEDLSENSAKFSIFAKTVQGRQFAVSRALRARALHVLSEAGVPLVGILRGQDFSG